MQPPNINKIIKIDANADITAILNEIQTHPENHGKIYRNSNDGSYYYKVKPEKGDKSLSIGQMIEEFIASPYFKGEQKSELKKRIRSIKTLIERKQEKIDRLGTIRRFFVEFFQHSISQNSKDLKRIMELENQVNPIFVKFQRIEAPLAPDDLQLSQNIKTLTDELILKLEKRETELANDTTLTGIERFKERNYIDDGKALLNYYSEIANRIIEEYPSWRKWKEDVMTKKTTIPWTREQANETEAFLYDKLKVIAHPVYFDEKIIDQSIEHIIVNFPEILLRTLEKITQEDTIKDQLRVYHDLYPGNPCLNARVDRITQYLMAPNPLEIDVPNLLTKPDKAIVQELYGHFTTQSLIKFAKKNQMLISQDILKRGNLSDDYLNLLNTCAKRNDFYDEENFSEQNFIKFVNQTVPNKFATETGKVNDTIKEGLKELVDFMGPDVSPFSKAALGVE